MCSSVKPHPGNSSLHSDAKDVETVSLAIPALPEQPTFFWDLKRERKTTATYMIPRAANFVAVDSVITAAPSNDPTAVCFQMMVAADGVHGLNTRGLKNVKAELQLKAAQPLHVVLVCPPSVLAKVKLQPFMKGKKVDPVMNPAGLAYGKGLIQYRLAVE